MPKIKRRQASKPAAKPIPSSDMFIPLGREIFWRERPGEQWHVGNITSAGITSRCGELKREGFILVRPAAGRFRCPMCWQKPTDNVRTDIIEDWTLSLEGDLVMCRRTEKQ